MTSRELPKLCTAACAKPAFSTAPRDLLEVGRLRELQLEHHAAGEVDPEIESADHERCERGDDQDGGHDVPAPCASP